MVGAAVAMAVETAAAEKGEVTAVVAKEVARVVAVTMYRRTRRSTTQACCPSPHTASTAWSQRSR